MADQNNTILFTAAFDAQKAEANILQLTKTLALLRSEKAALEKDFKSGAVNIDDYAKSSVALNRNLTDTQNQIKAESKALADNTTAKKAAEAAAGQMRTALSAQITSQDTVTKALKNGESAADAQQKRIKSLSDEYASLANTQNQSQQTTGQVTKGLTTLRDAFANNGTKIFGGQIQQFDGLFNKFKGGLDLIKNGLAGIKPAGDTAGIGFNTVKVGIASTGIGLLLLAFTSLIQYFTETAEGAKIVKAATAAVGAVFQVLKDVVSGVGKTIVGVFTDFNGTLERVNNALLHPIDSLKSFGSSILSFGQNVATAAKSAYELVGVEKALIKERRELEIQDVQERSRVEVLLRLSKDRSKSVSERQALLKEAGAVERKITLDNIALQEKELALIQGQLKNKGQGKDVGDLKQAEAEKRKEIAQTRATQEETLAGITAREGRFRNEEAALDKAATQKASEARKAAAKDAAQGRVSEAERALIMARKNGEETLSIELDLVKRKADVELLDAKGKGARALILAKADAEALKLRTEAAIKADTILFNTEESNIQARLSLVRKGSDEEFALQKELLTSRLNKEKANAVDTITNKKEQTAKLGELDAAYELASKELDKTHSTAQIERDNDLALKRLQTDQDLHGKTFKSQLAFQSAQIDQEEKHALALLALENITDEDRLVKRNAIQAKALAAKKELNQQEIEQEKKDAIAITEVRISQAIAGSKEELDLRKKLIDQKKDLELTGTKQTEAAKKKIEADARKQKEEAENEHAQKVASRIIDSVEASGSILSKLGDAHDQRQSQLLQQQEDAALKSAGLSADERSAIEEKFAKKKEELDRQSAERRRKIATFENAITIARGLVAAIAENAGDPFLQIFESALVVATGLAQQSVIASATYAAGGVAPEGPVFGPSHGNGGIQMYHKSGAHLGEFEGEEIILTKGVYQNPTLRAMASMVNEMAGGKSFAGPPNIQSHRFEYGDIVRMNAIAGGSQAPAAPIDYALLAKMVGQEVGQANASLPAPVTIIQDVNAAQGRVNRVATRADI